MTRFHATPDGPIPFTPEEEAEWDAVAATAGQRLREDQAAQIRQERNAKLAECDWTQLSDTPLNPEAKAAWAFYRENLRMVPEQPGFPWNVQWPPQPGAN